MFQKHMKNVEVSFVCVLNTYAAGFQEISRNCHAVWLWFWIENLFETKQSYDNNYREFPCLHNVTDLNEFWESWTVWISVGFCMTKKFQYGIEVLYMLFQIIELHSLWNQAQDLFRVNRFSTSTFAREQNSFRFFFFYETMENIFTYERF